MFNLEEFMNIRDLKQRGWSVSAIAAELNHSGPPNALGLFDHLARILHDLPGDPQQFAVFGFLLLLPLRGGHPLDLLHAAASAAGAIGKSLYPVGKFVLEIFDQTSDGAHRAPQ